MDRIDAMRVFVTAADKGSLAAAGRHLGHSAATVTRGIAMLEARLGTRLLHRTTRSLHLTGFGEAYVATCRDLLTLLDASERGAAAEQEKPSGVLTLTCPLRFGQLYVRPMLDDFLDANPAVQARLLMLDRVTNLLEEGIDVAVRIAHLPDSSLVAVRIGEVRRTLCAAPKYLETRGSPSNPAALPDHACIMDRSEMETWRFTAPNGKGLVSVPVRPRLIVNCAEAAIDSAIEGHGIARVMSYQAVNAITAGKLKVVLPEFEPAPIPVHIVATGMRSGTAKQRAFVAFSAPRLRAALNAASNAMRAISEVSP